MLVGEQAVPIAKRLLSGEPVTVSWFRAECVTRISGIAPPPPARTDSAAEHDRVA
jgi:xanthosine utilization system XapX-like protein